MSRTTTEICSLTRRRLLGGVAGVAAAAILAACGGEATVAPPAPTAAAPRPTTATVAATGATGATTAAPTTAPASMAMAATMAPATGATTATTATTAMTAAAPATMIEGAIPSGVPGVPDAYPKLPTPYKSTMGVPGKGGTVTHFAILFAAPPPRDGNSYWFEIEKRIGAKWDVTFAPSASYGEKVTATLAGGDLPDLFYMNYSPEFPGAGGILRTLQQGAFTDLTPFLTGDELKQYPNLSRLPAFLWDTMRINKKIYGVPKPILRVNNIPFYRGDWAKKLGIAKPTNTDQLHDMLVAFSKRDPDADGQPNTYGLSAAGGSWSIEMFRPMFRVPNDWIAKPDGTLTYYIETPEFRQCVEYMRRLYASGAYDPNAATTTHTQLSSNWKAGKLGMHTEGYINFWGNKLTTNEVRNPVEGSEVSPLVPPGFDGGKGATANGSGVFGFTGIPTKVGRDRERVKELLRIADYLSAPFGSEEWLFVNFGIEGQHFTRLMDGSPFPTDKGRAERPGLAYSFTSEHRFYFAAAPAAAEAAQQTAREAQAIAVDNPVLGLYSPTNDMKNAELTQLRVDRVGPVVAGREPVSALDAYIRDWRARGGDTIRKEYEQALRDNK